MGPAGPQGPAGVVSASPPLTFNSGTGALTIDLSTYAPLVSPTFTGDPRAPTPAFADNDTSIATTAWVTTALAGFQPLDGDLTAIAALTGTNVIYYRSAANTWAAVTIGTGLSFSAGTLAATAGGGDVVAAADNTFTGQNYFNGAATVFNNNALVDIDTTNYKVQYANAPLLAAQWSNNATGAIIDFAKSRNATKGSHTVVQNGDAIGYLQWLGSTGSGWSTAALIQGTVDGTPGTTVPGKLTFHTRSAAGGGAVARMTIANDGNVSLAASPSAGDNSTNVATTAFVQSIIPAGAWTPWTPTVTASSGTLTSTTVNTARYTRAGKTVTAFFDITITNAGTGGGFLLVTLPVAASASGGGAASGREYVLAGVLIGGVITPSSTSVGLVSYSGATAIATNARVAGTMIYEGT